MIDKQTKESTERAELEQRARNYWRRYYTELPPGWTENTLNYLNTQHMVEFAESETADLRKQLEFWQSESADNLRNGADLIKQRDDEITELRKQSAKPSKR